MRIAFMGTPAFATPALEACLAIGDVVAVVSQPDAPRGRGHKVSPSPVKTLAQARNLTVLQPRKLRDGVFAAELAAAAPDIAVVVAYGRILPPDVLRVPARGCVNVHASLLPRFRGAAPIQRCIAAGDARTGVCLMEMDAGLDTGPVIATSAIDIAAEDTAITLGDKLARLGASLVRDSLPKYVRGELSAVPQSKEGVVLAPPIQRTDARLDFHRTAPELERMVRAYVPWPKAHFATSAGRVAVLGARVGPPASAAPGMVLAACAAGVHIACGDSTSLFLTALQREGGKVLPAADFLRGHHVAIGEVWPCAVQP